MMKIYRFFIRHRKMGLVYMLALLGVFGWGNLLWEVPTEIYVTKGEEIKLEESIPVTFEQEDSEEVFADKWRDNYEMTCSFLGIIPVKTVTVHVVDEQEVIPVGQTVGILLQTDGVYVVATDEIETASGEKISPCKRQVKSGDYITHVNGIVVTQKEEVMEVVEASNGAPIELTLRRNDKTVTCDVTPVYAANHTYKLGIWIKDDIAGVGTITYIDGEGNYGALGHGISSAETEELVEIIEGNLYETEIAGINKGEKGTPGSLVGLLYFQREHYLGTVDTNSTVGIYGSLDNISDTAAGAEPMPVGYKQEIQTGPAEILASVDGVVKSYDIEIEDIVMNSPEVNKSMFIRVTDEELIAKTGGIVQGISGSPIIQNGKIVGAVTHVLVNDPTRGYGIFIESMLNSVK
ncbi:MAG: SpoIVB peptidase [Eubacterium sp.]|nr:SpoIVB peptidase [Eubacterium sp.]